MSPQCAPSPHSNTPLFFPLLHPLPRFCGGGPWWGWGRGSPDGQVGACCWPSLDVAAAAGASLGVCAVGLRGQSLVEGVEASVRGQGISPRRHPLIDAVQALRLFEAGDLVLWREAFDGCWDARKKMEKMGVILEGRMKWLKENSKLMGSRFPRSHSPTHQESCLIFGLMLFHGIIVRKQICFCEKMKLRDWEAVD